MDSYTQSLNYIFLHLSPVVLLIDLDCFRMNYTVVKILAVQTSA